MNYLNFFRRSLCVFAALLLAGCSIYDPTTHQYATEKFSKLSPHYVATKHGQIEYYHVGSGDPIVLIPGYATDVSSWNREFLAVLAQHHQIILLNNRNVGGSHTFSASYRSDDLANDTYQLIQTLGLKKPAIVGISMGGMIAQKLAVLHPDAVGSLILINTSIAGQHPIPLVEKKLLGLSKNKVGFYVSAIDLFFPPSWKIKMAYSLAADRFQPKDHTEIDMGAVMPQQQQLIKRWLHDDATAKKLGSLNLPVLILNGKADIVIPPANSVILAKVIPRAQLVRWNDGGHAMIFQYPEAIGDEINNFMAAE
jgi:pimeloyl-ACP methyl ester carboxylesterase